MAKSRFYISPADWKTESLTLAGDEFHHCRDVMRCGVGDRVVVFNGVGTEADVEILSMEKNGAVLKVWTVSETPRPVASLTLGQAVPKGKNMDLIVQKATELGASTIVPLLSERTVVRLDPGEAQKKQEKWQRVVIEACKQCGQNWLPEVALPVSVDTFLGKAGPSAGKGELRLVAALTDDARSLRDYLAESEPADSRPSKATVLIGPEGDFTPAEMSLALGNGFQPLTLGPIVLRSETAAIYALSVLGYELM
ncbi:MAG: 16S rRNA (uracil(1498)-N(3))-methyltransferase [Verrucomicrobiae bacterium]|nr:16S rRNA (uracil(1498)-N(3))-methyltransferase [Verrucomicrobiae bacterium]